MQLRLRLSLAVLWTSVAGAGCGSAEPGVVVTSAPTPAPTTRAALMCEAPPAVAPEEIESYGPSRIAEAEDPKDLCTVADTNVQRALADVLALPAPRANAAVASKAWDKKRDPVGLARITRRFGLVDADLARLRQNGFVVPARLGMASYAWAYHEIYQSELPIYISLDSIFHAVYAAHDHLVADLEERRLLPLTRDVLARMHCGLAAAAADYPTDTARDLDVYLTVARRLLEGSAVPSALGDASVDAEVTALVTRAMDAAELEEVTLFGRKRMIDFTQLQPRGHYAGNERLEPYFRSAMWLARTELNLVSRSSRSSAPGTTPDPSETPREDVMALALADLAGRTGAMADIGALDRAWELLAGRREDVSPMQLAELGRGIRITAPDAAEQLRAAIGEKFQRTARIHYMPQGSPVLPAIATLLGPRIVPDTATTRPLVHGEVPERYGLHGADFAWILGQDRARTYLAKDLAEFPQLAAGLDKARRALADAPRTDDLYTAWLDAIRGLAPLGDAASLPSFMQTAAFADLRMNTAIAAFAQLRHNHVLIAGQSYDEGGCAIPDGWVEPAPAAYDALIHYADRGAEVVPTLDPGDVGEARGYFQRLGKVLRALKVIGDYELAGVPLPEAAKRFLSQVVEMRPGGTGGPPTYTGWYFDLFQHREADGLKGADLIADVYTSTNAGISYLGVGAPRIGVFVVDRGGAPRLMVGPVARAYEHLGPLAKRLDDEAARRMPPSAQADPWAASYTTTPVPEPSLSLNYEAYWMPDDKPEKVPHNWVRLEAKEALGSVTLTLLDHHRRPLRSVTKKVGPGETRFAFPQGAADGPLGFAGIEVRVGKFQTWTEVHDVCSCADLRTGSYALADEEPEEGGDPATLAPPGGETGPAPRHVAGTLRHTPIPSGKSVEAYLGIEFVLEATGEKVVLSASKAVTPEALVALKNRAVEVTCIPRAPVAPSRDESYPMEPDGTPMKRPATCEVVAVRATP